MNYTYIRLDNKQTLFQKVPMYNKNNIEQTCIVKTLDSYNHVIWAFCDIPSGFRFGRTFKTLKEARAFIGSAYYMQYINKLRSIRINSEHYKKLVEQRITFLKRMNGQL